MLYYNGIDLVAWLLRILVAILLGFAAFGMVVTFQRANKPVEKVIGYEIDEMRTPTGEPFSDTVAVIVKRGDSIFIKDIGAYKFITKETKYVRTLDATDKESTLNPRQTKGQK